MIERSLKDAIQQFKSGIKKTDYGKVKGNRDYLSVAYRLKFCREYFGESMSIQTDSIELSNGSHKFKANIYLNDKLKVQEEDDYLDRIETCPEKYTEEGFKEKQFKFGTLSILTNLKANEEDIYQTYKMRIEVEKLADVLKNTLEIDKSYMRDETSLEGWVFINHIASVIYYKIYNLLLEKKLLSKYSPNDILDYLATIKKIKINKHWEYAEIPGKVKKITELLDISIT